MISFYLLLSVVSLSLSSPFLSFLFYSIPLHSSPRSFDTFHITENLTDFWRQFGLNLCCRTLELTLLEILADVLSYVARDA